MLHRFCHHFLFTKLTAERSARRCSSTRCSLFRVFLLLYASIEISKPLSCVCVHHVIESEIRKRGRLFLLTILHRHTTMSPILFLTFCVPYRCAGRVFCIAENTSLTEKLNLKIVVFTLAHLVGVGLKALCSCCCLLRLR